MVKSRKFRGVRQRYSGSWVSEIRHPILKRRVWLGTFETAEEAAQVYDQAAITMSGRKAKTNFPVTPSSSTEAFSSSSLITTLKNQSISQLLHAKLNKSLSPSLTCLKLDTQSSQIGVWQKRAGHYYSIEAKSTKWITTLHFEDNQICKYTQDQGGELGGNENMDQEQRIALQMIEEFLNGNCLTPTIPFQVAQYQAELIDDAFTDFTRLNQDLDSDLHFIN